MRLPVHPIKWTLLLVFRSHGTRQDYIQALHTDAKGGKFGGFWLADNIGCKEDDCESIIWREDDGQNHFVLAIFAQGRIPDFLAHFSGLLSAKIYPYRPRPLYEDLLQDPAGCQPIVQYTTVGEGMFATAS